MFWEPDNRKTFRHFRNVQYIIEFITFSTFMALTFELTRKGEGLTNYYEMVCMQQRLKKEVNNNK